jgi:hypothetical protein
MKHVREWKYEHEDRDGADETRKSTGKTLKVGCDMKGGLGWGVALERGILREEIALSLDKSLTTPDWVGLGDNEPERGKLQWKVKIKQDEILRNDGHRGGNEDWNTSENVRKVEVGNGESLGVGGLEGRTLSNRVVLREVRNPFV